MSFFKESYRTLQLFLWFVALSSFAALVSTAIDVSNGIEIDGWIYVDVPLNLAFALGAGYFALNIRTLVPFHAEKIIRIIKIAFLINVVLSIIAFVQFALDPSAFDPGYADNAAVMGAVGGLAIGLGFAYLIYAVINSSIRRLAAGGESGDDAKKSRLYWMIFAVLLILVGISLFYDPATGSFTTELGA